MLLRGEARRATLIGELSSLSRIGYPGRLGPATSRHRPRVCVREAMVRCGQSILYRWVSTICLLKLEALPIFKLIASVGDFHPNSIKKLCLFCSLAEFSNRSFLKLDWF